MVSFASVQPDEKRVRITLAEARVLSNAVLISILQSPPPDCCKDVLDSVMARIANAFDLDIVLDRDAGTISIDGQVCAEIDDAEKEEN